MAFAAVTALATVLVSSPAMQAMSSASASVSGNDDAMLAARNASATFPSGDDGKIVAYGYDLFTKTRTVMAPYITAQMACEACHINAGRKPHGGSLLGIYAQFPQWNERSHRFIALQDRIAECFLYSMNGRTPAYTSREMIALTAYIAFLSRGAKVGTGFSGQGLATIKPDHAPDPQAGRAIYAQQCSACHAADGGGHGASFPPLWGPASFNTGAGMHRISTMAEFVRYNMPFGAKPNTLSAQQAYDVSAYILSNERPRFVGSRDISFPARPAGFF
jgi:thiosulfate dehydrogenase